MLEILRWRATWRLGLFVVLLGVAGHAHSQTVTIDGAAARAIPFDPDLALGSSMDILPTNLIDRVYSEEILRKSLSAGWGPITYRQNTELTIADWHWNGRGTWSDPAHESGYFTGSAEPREFLRHSYGYRLPHRGTTRSDDAATEFSRLTDGDARTYWKSNPYLAKRFTGDEDAQHPQWIVVDFDTPQSIDAIRIDWAAPYARNYLLQYWTGEDAINKQGAGNWITFAKGTVTAAAGGEVHDQVQRLADAPVKTRFVRVWMTESSNTCDTHGVADPRNCAGYAVNEIYVGNFTGGGEFVDLVQHARGQNQTATYVSSIDPWHTSADIEAKRDQTGFDLFFTSGITNKLPAMIPVSMVYGTPEDSAAEITYIEKRGYPISYVEMGEEPDGQFMLPEDYGALYLQWAKALHAVDPKLRLGGPVFTGSNEDIQAWPDANGKTSWLERFIDYLKSHGRMNDLSFVSFEHYPFAPCEIVWSDLYREPRLVKHILQTWRDDGVPANVPLMITESNVSWELTQPMADTFAALWLADNAGAFLANGGAVFYHSPIQPEPLRPGCHGWSTYGNFVADEKLQVKQFTSQYFASQLINLEWVKHGAGAHQLFPAHADILDDAGNELVTAYAVKRPDGEWSVLLVNKDASNAHRVKLVLDRGDASVARQFLGTVSLVTFGAAEYVWHPDGANSHADPDGPLRRISITADKNSAFELPKASVAVLRGKMNE
jgi:F5/8 type C domain